MLTDHNANVSYELGIRHVLSKGTDHDYGNSQHLPFDISHHGTLMYEDSITAALDLEERLNAFVNRIENSQPIDASLSFWRADVTAALNNRGQELAQDYERRRDDSEKVLHEQPGALKHPS